MGKLRPCCVDRVSRMDHLNYAGLVDGTYRDVVCHVFIRRRMIRCCRAPDEEDSRVFEAPHRALFGDE